MWTNVLSKMAFFIGGLCTMGGLHAQYLRTSYFIEGTSARLQLNPALQPMRGYVNVPILNAFMGASSNVLGLTDIIDVLDSGRDLFPNDDLYNRLDEDNRFNVRANTDLFSFGWYKGCGFWNVDVRLRTDVSASIPKGMFEYFKNVSEYSQSLNRASVESRGTLFQRSIYNVNFDVNAYAEVGVGYSRAVNERLVVGGRFNLLLGLVHTDMQVDHFTLNVETADDIYQSSVYSTVKANVKASMKGGGLSFSEVDDGSGNIVRQVDRYNFDMGGFGISGVGMGIDLGASYRILDNVIVSAAVLDLGFIRWNSGMTTVASADDVKIGINGDNYMDYMNGDFMDLKRFNMFENKDAVSAYNTKLSSTFLVAGEYKTMDDKLSLGIMYSAYFVQPKTLNEVTLSATFHPKTWCDFALSYSPVQAGGKSFGLALKLGPVFLGTDYVYFNNNSKASNAFLGVSFPLGKGIEKN
ncbi:DUF5723 family protein [Phocaeicola sp. HCN-6420]|jgi:hypothetical protein|uniref:DUF5723 family protein n=1 Tax=Phocaeicola sp. HCN-6420 TaxID=3134673 RepID=UPI0030C38384